MVEAVLDAGGFLHGFTSAGNPLSCAAGLAVLDEIERLDLIANAARMGEILKDRLTGLMDRYAFIGDVRGKGLLMAFEMMADRDKQGAAAQGAQRPFPIGGTGLMARGLILYSRRDARRGTRATISSSPRR